MMPEKIPDKIHNYLYQPKSEKAGTASQLVESIENRRL
jgi:hypothetical protein